MFLWLFRIFRAAPAARYGKGGDFVAPDPEEKILTAR